MVIIVQKKSIIRDDNVRNMPGNKFIFESLFILKSSKKILMKIFNS